MIPHSILEHPLTALAALLVAEVEGSLCPLLHFHNPPMLL